MIDGRRCAACVQSPLTARYFLGLIRGCLAYTQGEKTLWTRHETHLPSFEDSPRPHPRLSGSHEDPWRSRHHQCSPRQGPQTPRSLRPKPAPERRPRTVSAPRIAVTHALTQASDFTQVLNAPSRARTAHFAVHHLPCRPAVAKKAAAALGKTDLSTEISPQSPLPVDELPLTGLWLGLVVPKRHAKRAVTRTLLKRRIRAAIAMSSAVLPSGLWVVRLRTPFDRSEFISAASERLGRAATQELTMLMAAAVARGPR